MAQDRQTGIWKGNCEGKMQKCRNAETEKLVEIEKSKEVEK